MTKLAWILVGVAVVLLLVFGGHRRDTTTVSIHNQSSETLTDVRISLAGKEIWRGPLAADEVREAYGRPDVDGAISISFETNGRSVRGNYGYVAALVGDRYDFEVTESFEIRPTPPP